MKHRVTNLKLLANLYTWGLSSRIDQIREVCTCNHADIFCSSFCIPSKEYPNHFWFVDAQCMNYSLLNKSFVEFFVPLFTF